MHLFSDTKEYHIYWNKSLESLCPEVHTSISCGDILLNVCYKTSNLNLGIRNMPTHVVRPQECSDWLYPCLKSSTPQCSGHLCAFRNARRTNLISSRTSQGGTGRGTPCVCKRSHGSSLSLCHNSIKSRLCKAR